jgi:hypothetical protein
LSIVTSCACGSCVEDSDDVSLSTLIQIMGEERSSDFLGTK